MDVGVREEMAPSMSLIKEKELFYIESSLILDKKMYRCSYT